MDMVSRIEYLEKAVADLQLQRQAPNGDCLTVQDVANILGCTADTVRKYESQGLIVALWPNAKRRFVRQDVIEFLKGRADGKLRKKNRQVDRPLANRRHKKV